MIKHKYIISKLNYIRSSPQKIRLFTKILKNKSLINVLDYFNLSNDKISSILKKGLFSLLNNAKHNYNLDPNKLIIKQIKVDKGPSYKRILPRAKGKIDYIYKTTSNITFIVKYL